MDPARNGTEQRLDAIIDALQGINQALTVLVPVGVPEPVEESEIVELREPEPEPEPAPKPKPKKARK